VGTLLMTYIGEGGGILSYLAIGGTAFVIAYSGPGPRSDVLESIWSVWGISFGMIIRAALTLLWREHSYRTLAEEFETPLAALLELIHTTEDTSNTPRRTAATMRVAESIQAMLGVANDALLEGRSAGIDPNNLIDSLDTLLRLALMFSRADLGTAVSASVTDAIRWRLEAWLEKLTAEIESGMISPAPLRRMILEGAGPALDSNATSRETAPEASFQREVDRRVIALTRTLEHQLSAISLNR
jgi:hypothetical protein